MWRPYIASVHSPNRHGCYAWLLEWLVPREEQIQNALGNALTFTNSYFPTASHSTANIFVEKGSETMLRLTGQQRTKDGRHLEATYFAQGAL
jgi:hypothetical protein